MSKTDRKGLHHLHITLTPEQYRLLSEQAKSCGLTKRAYFIRLMEGRPAKAKTSQEIKDLRWEVHKIGVNINQIARSVNAGIARVEDAKHRLYLLGQVYELMYQIAQKQRVKPPGPFQPLALHESMLCQKRAAKNPADGSTAQSPCSQESHLLLLFVSGCQ